MEEQTEEEKQIREGRMDRKTEKERKKRWPKERKSAKNRQVWALDLDRPSAVMELLAVFFGKVGRRGFIIGETSIICALDWRAG